MNSFNWKIEIDSKFPATLMITSDGHDIPALVIARNNDCYSSLPVEDLDFIVPIDVLFKDADKHIKEISENDSEVSESDRLNYACEIFKEDFIKQLQTAMQLFRR